MAQRITNFHRANIALHGLAVHDIFGGDPLLAVIGGVEFAVEHASLMPIVHEGRDDTQAGQGLGCKQQLAAYRLRFRAIGILMRRDIVDQAIGADDDGTGQRIAPCTVDFCPRKTSTCAMSYRSSGPVVSAVRGMTVPSR